MYLQAAITTFFTIITGVFLYIFSGWYDDSVRKRREEYIDLVAEITILVYFHAHKTHNPLKNYIKVNEITFGDYKMAKKELRTVASKLLATSLKSKNKLKRSMIGLPSHEEVMKAIGYLTGISNGLIASDESVYYEDLKDNVEFEKSLKSLLGIE